MKTEINKINKISTTETTILFLRDIKKLKSDELSDVEIKYIKEQHEKQEKNLISFNRITKWIFIQFIKDENEKYKTFENCMKSGSDLVTLINNNKIETVVIHDLDNLAEEILALAEGMALSNYQFIKYKTTKKEKQRNTLKSLKIFSAKVSEQAIKQLKIIIDATLRCRDLINEPVCYLNAEKLSHEIENMFKGTDAKVEVMNKKKIETLKMGGLLAVNRGSIDPPTFTVIEWKPKHAKNKKPIVLVGKGIVYDTGGINLKPANYMDTMKHDMSGAAAVASAIYAISQVNLPIYVIGLIPATDNRPDGNAYVPDDVITMHDGTTVEVKNTDAEGRLILADALSYAKKFNPEVVIDIATLTGAAARAIGKYATVGMSSKAEKEFELLKKCGFEVFERVVEFPFWDEYAELIKSDIADIKNTGAIDAGAITAGKFLEHFTDYPFIHLDIAGPAFNEKKDSYRGIGGTGVGVRLFFKFISAIHATNQKKDIKLV